MNETQATLIESNRLVVETNRQVAASITNVMQSNSKMDTSNNNIALIHETMTKRFAAMSEMNKGVARSNALMTEMNV
jgi:hypothetical protein